MQYLYVLTSGFNDTYYEQFLLSVTSLRLLMLDVEVTLLCDSKTKETLTGKRSGYEKLISRVIVTETPEMPQVEVSRWVKTSMRRLVSGDFLFIDCDTIITDDLSSITGLGIQFGACLDKHSLIDSHTKSEGIIKRDKQLGFSSYLSNRHINSGVIFCADIHETHKIFDRWHELWLFSNSKNTVRDQPSFNMAIYENSSFFTELDGTWNCQIAFNGLPYLANSKIIHYFASDLVMHTSPYILASDNIFNQIKDTGVIPDEVLELLKNSRAAFVSESRIIAGENMLSVINSNFFVFIFLMRKKMPGLFNAINRLCFIGRKIVKFILVIMSKKKEGGIKHYN
ncbi:MAG: glycosyltransferase [Treponema sp.]|nr:glycosyltransferase [Treponema sp.]